MPAQLIGAILGTIILALAGGVVFMKAPIARIAALLALLMVIIISFQVSEIYIEGTSTLAAAQEADLIQLFNTYTNLTQTLLGFSISISLFYVMVLMFQTISGRSKKFDEEKEDF